MKKSNLVEALNTFKSSVINLGEAMEQAGHPDGSLAPFFPFPKTFSEMSTDISAWVDNSIECIVEGHVQTSKADHVEEEQNDLTYILCGNEACRVYFDEGFEALAAIEDVHLHVHDPKTDGIEQLLVAVAGWGDTAILSKFEYELLTTPEKHTRKVIGYQIESKDGKHDIPEGMASFEIFRIVEDAAAWIDQESKKYDAESLANGEFKWMIVPVFEGVIEEPTIIS